MSNANLFCRFVLIFFNKYFDDIQEMRTYLFCSKFLKFVHFGSGFQVPDDDIYIYIYMLQTEYTIYRCPRYGIPYTYVFTTVGHTPYTKSLYRIMAQTLEVFRIRKEEQNPIWAIQDLFRSYP